MDAANETPTRPWLIYVDGELYGDVKTKTDRDKALSLYGRGSTQESQEERSALPVGRAGYRRLLRPRPCLSPGPHRSTSPSEKQAELKPYGNHSAQFNANRLNEGAVTDLIHTCS